MAPVPNSRVLVSLAEQLAGTFKGMEGLVDVWEFTRMRLKQAHEDLTHEQGMWRPFKGANTIIEMMYHMAGAEHWFGCRILGINPEQSEFERKLDMSVRAQFLTGDIFPFTGDELTLEKARNALDFSEIRARKVLSSATPEQLAIKIESPMGPIVDGKGGLLRIAQHSGYHTGQIWTYRQMPEFPEA